MLKKTILFTGGHLGPLLAALSGLNKQNYRIIVVGRRHAFEKQAKPGLEYVWLKQYPNYKFYTLDTGRFTTGQALSVPVQILKTIKGIFQAFRILNKEKPSLIVSFGGYLSFPICFVARLKNIEIRLHEQTIAPGKANLIIAKLANKVFVTFKQSLSYFPKHKTKLIGISLHPSSSIQKPEWLNKKPLLLILGGSSGSHSINKLVDSILVQLLNNFQIVHQTGENSYRDYEKALNNKGPNYHPLKYLWPDSIAYFYTKADLVISRCGANTFFEIIKFQKPCVLIPLPWSANQEQLHQAEILQKAGVGSIFSQNLNPDLLFKLINETYKNRLTHKQNFKNLSSYSKLIIPPSQFAHELLS